MQNIDVMKIVNQIIAWCSTLGVGGTLLLLKIAGRLTRKVMKLLLFGAVAGIAYLYLSGSLNFDFLNNLFR